MEKFVRYCLAVLILFGTCGCGAPISSYIKAEHPYARKVYGDYDKIVGIASSVLEMNGWQIQRVTNSSVYERSNEEGENSDKDLVIMTTVRKRWKIFYTSFTHVNLFLHPTAEGAQIDLRWAKVTPLMFIKFTKTRNDRLANDLLRQIEDQLTAVP